MFQLFEVFRQLVWIFYKVVTMGYDSLILIILTALGVMLAVLAIGIAVLAVMGYAGFKDMVRDAAVKQVTEAMSVKLKEYPQAAEITALVEQLKAQAALQSQIGITPETGTGMPASNELPKTAEIYPGEEPPNVSDTPTTAPSGPASVDPGTDNH